MKMNVVMSRPEREIRTSENSYHVLAEENVNMNIDITSEDLKVIAGAGVISQFVDLVKETRAYEKDAAEIKHAEEKEEKWERAEVKAKKLALELDSFDKAIKVAAEKREKEERVRRIKLFLERSIPLEEIDEFVDILSEAAKELVADNEF